MAWVNPEMRDDPNGFYPSNVVSNDNPGQFGRGFGVNVYPSGSSLVVEYNNGFYFSGFSFNASKWYHVAVVYSDGNFKTYVNGNLADDFNFSQSTPNGVNFIRIGWHNDDSG